MYLPVLVSDEGPCQLDVMAGLRLELAHCGLTLFDHVEKHLRQLRILIQVHQVRKTIVHFERHTCFLTTQRKFLHSHIFIHVWTRTFMTAGFRVSYCDSGNKSNLHLFGLFMFADFSLLQFLSPGPAGKKYKISQKC